VFKAYITKKKEKTPYTIVGKKYCHGYHGKDVLMERCNVQ